MRSVVTALLVVLAAPAHGQPAPPIKAPAIAQTCVACHGIKGVSTTKDSPSLAGQPDIFTQYQLVFMRDGQRQPGVMAGIVKTLTDQNIRDLGAYYAALPPPPPFAKAGAGRRRQGQCDHGARGAAAIATRRTFPARARPGGWPASGPTT